MKRRDLLKGAVAGGLAVTAASTFPKPAISQGRQQLKMVTSWPKNYPGLGTEPENFAKRISDLTDGRISIKVYAGGELVPPLKCNDAVQEGTADMYHSADYYYIGKSKAYPFFTAVPGGLLATEMDAWIMHGGGQKLWDEVGAEFGIKHLLAGSTGVQMGGWFRKKMDSLEDFKGLKMRIPGLGGDVIAALGGTSVTLAGAEILPALQAGTVDASEWVGPWNDLAFGFYKITQNYYYPGVHEPGAQLSLGINKKVWDGLSKTDQLMFESVAIAEHNRCLAEFNANNTAALDTLINRHGVKVWEFSDEIFKAMMEAAHDVVASAGNTDALSKKVYASYLDFRKKAIRWTGLSDQAYANKRALAPS